MNMNIEGGKENGTSYKHVLMYEKRLKEAVERKKKEERRQLE
jgi:hypothetical protein